MRSNSTIRNGSKTQTRFAVMFALTIGLCGCAGQQETPRDFSEIGTDNTVLIFGPSVSNATEEGIKITYAQASMGFDTGCDPNRTFSDELNECTKLPVEVKEEAMSQSERKSFVMMSLPK